MKLMQHWQNIRPTLEAATDGGSGGSADPAPGGDPAGAPAPDGAPAADAGAPDGVPAAPDFSFIPEQFRGENGPDFDGFRAHYEEMVAAQAIQQEALSDVPADPTGYEYAVPETIDFGDLELPDDFSVQLNTEDPALAPVFEELGSVLHKHNLPKGAASELLGVMAKYQATEFSKSYQQAQQEYQSLGPTADARISNINRTLDSRLPAELAQALKGATTSANGVKALEALLRPRGPATTLPQPPEPAQKNPLAARYPTSI